MRVHKYRKLQVWQKAMALAKKIYNHVTSFPTHEKYALSDQLRRAAVSIPSNIAEGYGRISPKERIHFLSIALGSLYEVDTQLLLSVELKYNKEEDLFQTFELIVEISKMLVALIKREQNSLTNYQA